MIYTQAIALVLSLLAVLTVAACGGSGGGLSDAPQAIARPPVNAASFAELALQAPCADITNRFYVINQKFVFRDVKGRCTDAAWSKTLYGATPQDVLCTERDGIGGPVASCDPAFRALFAQIDRNRDRADLGLGSNYKVEALMPGTTVGYRTIDSSAISGIGSAQNTVIRDAGEWARVWALHSSNIWPAPALPTVDFSRKMVLAMFNGQKPNGCHGFGSIAVSSIAGTLRVVHVVSEPDPASICTMSVVSPALLIEVDRSDAPVRFVGNAYSF